MSWVAAGTAAVGLIGGALSNRSAKKANNKALQAQKAAAAANAANFQPYMDYGKNNLNTLNQLNAGNFSSFFTDPSYQFTRDQGIGAIDASASARGNLFGGGTSTDLARFGTGLASQGYGNYYNRVANAANMGMNAASALAGNNQNVANAQGQAAQNNANSNNQLIGIGTGLAGNLLNSYMGARTGGSRNSSYNGGGTMFNGQMNTGQGSSYNFGNNFDNFNYRGG